MISEVFVEGCEDYFSCTNIGFQRFRIEIMRGWNQELGELFQRHYSYLWEKQGNIGSFFQMLELFQKKQSSEDLIKINKILNEYDKPYNEGMKIFAYISDNEGEITPKECALLLKSFERVDPDKFDNSDMKNNEWLRKSYDTWMKMMVHSIENNKSIIFSK